MLPVLEGAVVECGIGAHVLELAHCVVAQRHQELQREREEGRKVSSSSLKGGRMPDLQCV